MTGYITNFTIYTMAMIGLICFAIFVYKKITEGGFHSANTNFLGVEESMTLSPRKTLHVIRAGNEKFLIASDAERTTLISKLDSNTQLQQVKDLDRFKSIPINDMEIENFQTKDRYISKEALPQAKTKQKLVQLEPIKNARRQSNTTRSSAMREMAKKINQL